MGHLEQFSQMPQTVEIPDHGIAEFPDEMSPDEIKGVIQQKFYSAAPAADTEPPKPAHSLYGEIVSGKTAGELSANPVALTIGKFLGAAQDIGKEAFTGILPPEMMQTIFGSDAGSLREEEKSKPLISPAASREILGTLPSWVGGPRFAEGASRTAAGALSEFSKPSAIAQVPAFIVPGVAETFAANVLADLPKQYSKLRDTIKTHGLTSEETGAAAAEAGIEDLMGFLALKGGAAGRSLAAHPTGLPEIINRIYPRSDNPAMRLAPETAPAEPVRPATEPLAATVAREAAAEPALPVAAAQAAIPVLPGMVRLYHGAAKEAGQAGTDFTPNRDYAQGYADKSNGQVWYVDVPQDSAFLARDEGNAIPGQESPLINGQKVPDEVAKQAKLLEAPSVPEPTAAQTEGGLPVPDLKSTEEAVAHGKSGTADVPALNAKREELLAQAETATGDEKVALITQAQLYREAAEMAEKLQPTTAPEDATIPDPRNLAQDVDETGAPITTGIAQRVHEARAAEGRQGEILPGEGVTPEEMIQRGRELLKGGADPEQIIAGVAEGKAVTGDEMATLRARHEELSKATDQAADTLRKTPDDPVAKQAYEDAFKAETEFAQRIKPAATEWHKVGQSMQGETDIDTGSFTGLRRAFRDRTGRDVTPAESVKLEKTAENVQRVNADVEKAKSAFSEAVKKETKTTLPKSVEDLRAHFAERLKELLPCEI